MPGTRGAVENCRKLVRKAYQLLFCAVRFSGAKHVNSCILIRGFLVMRVAAASIRWSKTVRLFAFGRKVGAGFLKYH